MTSTADPAAGATGRELERLWVLFAVTWAVAVLFHLAGNTRVAPPWSRALFGLAAVAVLAWPRSRVPAGILAATVLVGVWLEAPVLGNHWLLHGFVALVVLGGLALRPADSGDVIARIAGPLRLVLLAFYAFAAFAKLNTDFFDPAVSCGRFYLEESAASWGLGGLVDGWSAGAQRAVAVVVAAVELGIPVLLVGRRTRSIGVLVALAFHFVLALDRTHQFFDFSSVLVALFLLFLPADGVAAAIERTRGLGASLATRWSSGPELLRLLGLAGAALVVVVATGPGEWPAPPALKAAGVTVWFVYGIATFAFAVTALRRGTAPRPLLSAHASRALLVVPVLAVLNGLTPYVEVKTAASWNMYSNLAVVDGESNHLVIRRGVPLTDAHERLVEVVDADGVDLSFYVASPWGLPEVMLVDHLADRPGAVVTGIVDGEQVRYVGGDGGARPAWQRKLQVFRAVDLEPPVSCQPSFGPAR